MKSSKQHTKLNIQKVLRGDRVIFVGNPQDITALYNSAFNWGAIDAKFVNQKMGGQIEAERLTSLGSMLFFSVPTKAILRWRTQATLAAYEVDFDFVGYRTLKFAAKRAKNWLNTLTTIPAWEFHAHAQVIGG